MRQLPVHTVESWTEFKKKFEGRVVYPADDGSDSVFQKESRRFSCAIC